MFKYKLAKNTIDKGDYDALIEWLKTYPILVKNNLTKEFEYKWAKYIGTKYAVFCNSGSSANLLMIFAAKYYGKLVNKNNKIVVPSVGWITTIAPAIQAGFEPIMIGADENTYGIDIDELEKICEKEPPSVVIFVQVLGVPHYKNRLLSLQKKYNFMLLEDACAALGAKYNDGIKVGAVGNMSSFSFYFGHQLSTIEGGMINTNDYELYQLLVMLRSHGWGKDLDESYKNELIKKYKIDDFHQPFTFFVPGFNLRSTDLQAFIGLRQVERADFVSKKRYENHLYYAQKLQNYVTFQDWEENYPVSISFGALAENNTHRKEIVERLEKEKIETRIFSAGNLGLHPFWKNLYGEFNNRISNKIHSSGFFLPNNQELSTEDIDIICDIVKGV